MEAIVTMLGILFSGTTYAFPVRAPEGENPTLAAGSLTASDDAASSFTSATIQHIPFIPNEHQHASISLGLSVEVALALFCICSTVLLLAVVVFAMWALAAVRTRRVREVVGYRNEQSHTGHPTPSWKSETSSDTSIPDLETTPIASSTTLDLLSPTMNTLTHPPSRRHPRPPQSLDGSLVRDGQRTARPTNPTPKMQSKHLISSAPTEQPSPSVRLVERDSSTVILPSRYLAVSALDDSASGYIRNVPRHVGMKKKLSPLLPTTSGASTVGSDQHGAGNFTDITGRTSPPIASASSSGRYRTHDHTYNDNDNDHLRYLESDPLSTPPPSMASSADHLDGETKLWAEGPVVHPPWTHSSPPEEGSLAQSTALTDSPEVSRGLSTSRSLFSLYQNNSIFREPNRDYYTSTTRTQAPFTAADHPLESRTGTHSASMYSDENSLILGSAAVRSAGSYSGEEDEVALRLSLPQTAAGPSRQTRGRTPVPTEWMFPSSENRDTPESGRSLTPQQAPGTSASHSRAWLIPDRDLYLSSPELMMDHSGDASKPFVVPPGWASTMRRASSCTRPNADVVEQNRLRTSSPHQSGISREESFQGTSEHEEGSEDVWASSDVWEY